MMPGRVWLGVCGYVDAGRDSYDARYPHRQGVLDGPDRVLTGSDGCGVSGGFARR